MEIQAATHIPSSIYEDFSTPTQDQIAQAQADLFDFLISKECQDIFDGTCTDLKDQFLDQRRKYPDPDERFRNYTEQFFINVIFQAEFDESVGDVFFSRDIDRVQFTEQVMKDLIAYAIVQERVGPNPSLEQGAYQAMMKYLASDPDELANLRNWIAEITEEASGNFDQAYPSFKTAFIEIMQIGTTEGHLSKEVSDLFFTEGFNQQEFIRRLIQGVVG